MPVLNPSSDGNGYREVASAIPVPRGCGQRAAGGIYIEASAGCAQNMLTLLDPPILIPEEMAVPTQGMGYIKKNGVYHLIDRVGESHYPNVADFIEEARRFGVSRRIQRTFLFDLLTPESRLLLIHPRAYVVNILDYPGWDCPKHYASHAYVHRNTYGFPCCAGVWWQDLTGEMRETEMAGSLVRVERTMPSFSYLGWKRPAGLQPNYREAFFASVPISAIAIVRDELGSHVAAMQAAGAAHIPTTEVDC